MDVDRLSVLHRGPYLVYGRPLMLKVMPRYFDFDDKDVSTMPVWVNLPGLSLEFWNTNTLGKIVSKVGKPISTDKIMATRGRLSCARTLVEIDASIELVREVKIRLPNGTLKEQEIVYEHEPKICGSCKVFGHTPLGCNIKHAGGRGTKDGNSAATSQSPPTEIANRGKVTGQQSGVLDEQQRLHLNQNTKHLIDDQQGQILGQGKEPFVEVISKKNRAVSGGNLLLMGTQKSGPISSSYPNEADSSNLKNEKLKGKVEEKRKSGSKVDKKKGASLASTS
ncbi:uncharacterized protein LOC111404733 [Olea europaea var. sylvestris]|uniref:uncharacterized protein LOC111404733 n=1 Tax=Olea europaea var. sylvestris TaxID=158386 RepID=UPI000C1D6622|nr:uncharacterized protein LOC111404733 [Olea europaea var. sylvestris]